MKKSFILGGLLFLTQISFAQETDRIITVPSHPTQEIKTYTPQQEFDLAKNLGKEFPNDNTINSATISSLADRNNPSLSAEASANVRFKDVPVNLATGAMYLPIPLYTLNEGLLSVPISIDYNGSGMKNQEVASWCGAGWNLTAGGMITRMVRGIPDEGLKSGSNNLRGYYKFGFSGNGTSVDNDTEPDVFFLNINGASYKMMYRYDGQNAKFEFFPDNDIKVIPTFQFLSGNTTVGKFVSFEVVLPDGVHYFFGNTAIEKTVEAEAGFIQSAGNYPGTTGFTNFWQENAQTSVWYLTKIISPYGQEINFDYDDVHYSYYRIADHGVDNTQTPASVCPSPSDVAKEINRVFVSSVSLAAIKGINTKIEFNQRQKVCGTDEGGPVCEYFDLSNPRLDLETWSRYPQNSSNTKRLNEMLVMENTASPQDTLFYKFSYGHFFGVTIDLPTGYSENNASLIRVGYTHQRRLRLEKIEFPDQTDVRFRYKGDAPNYNGKSRLDYGIDHWGYANGYTGNKSLTGLIPKDSDYPNCTAPTSNRESDAAFGFYGSMDSVIFSNRKTIAFDYEIHTAKNYKDASGNLKPIGGPRIKSVTNKDLISGIITKKEYDYTVNGQTTGHLALKPTYRYKTPFQEIGSHSSIYDRLLAEMGRPPVVYSRVTERILNTSNQGLGKMVYYFDNDTTALTTYEKQIVNCTGQYPNQTCDTVEYIRPEKVHPSWVDGNWDYKLKTANLLKTETFNESGDTLAVQIWQYSPMPIWQNYPRGTASKVFRVNNRNLGAYLANSTNQTYNFTQQYFHYFTKYRLENQITKTFSQTGNNPLISTVNYVYKDEMPYSYQQNYPGKHNQLVKTETVDSKGQFIENYIKYPADFDFTDTTIYVAQTCYDSQGPYDCGYSQYIPAVPVSGSQARGIFEFKDHQIWTFPIESNSKIDARPTGANYTTIETFVKPNVGFNYAPKKSYSAGRIGNTFDDLQYFKLQNDTIQREQSYFEIQRIEEYNDYGLPQKSKTFGGNRNQVIYDASKLLVSKQIANIGGVFVDSVQIDYAKKLFGASKMTGINHLESHTIFDLTNKKGTVKQRFDKDGNLLGRYDYAEPLETLAGSNLITDNAKFRTLARMPRTARSDLPPDLDSLDTQLSYYDAGGRMLQNKAVNASPYHKDLIAATPVFDSYGRPQKSILPVPSAVNNGNFESNILAKAQTFYSDTQPQAEVTQFEASPFSRAFKSIGAGAAFRPNKEGVQTFETGNFGINLQKIDINNVWNKTTNTGNQISKTTSTDEQGNKSISYTDKEGRMLESWVQFTGDGSDPSHFLKTTYVYDYLGRQVAVLPPLIYGQIPDGTNILSSSFIDYIYFVKYDSRGRAVESTVPDGGWSYVVYNRLGQTVLSQNARQRESNLWEWSKYGARGQQVLSGILTQNTYSKSQIQQFFDDFTEDKQFEERTASGGQEGYSIRSFPSQIQAFISNADIKTVNYFDDYTWNTNSDLNFKKYKTERWPNSKSLLTGTKVRRLDTNQWLVSAMYYDDKNRLIQTQSENRFDAINQTDLVLDFIGQLDEERTIYRKPTTAPDSLIEIKNTYTYDHAGRKLEVVNTFNGKSELLASYEYDELGRLVQKNLNEARTDSIIRQNPVLVPKEQDIAKHYILLQPGTCISGDSVYTGQIAAGLQKVAYSYDIRGNLRCINCVSTDQLDSSKVFATKLDYFQDGRFYNGLLSKQTWLVDSVQRSYLYDYDKANRYTDAIFSGSAAENYDENAAYDVNGNLLKLNRFGESSSNTFLKIDSLTYSYSNNSNRLNGITDLASNTLGHKDNGNVTDYTYYTDGSLKTDANKGITNTIYNYLGLPDEIQFGSNGKIKNLYTSDGQKLAQLLISGTDTVRTDYVGDLIYKNGNLETVFHDEGRIRVALDTTINNWSDTLGNHYSDTTIALNTRYQYFIQDHLGNNRVIFEKLNDSLFVAQRVDYYPFGSPFSDSLSFSFTYQNKEYINFFGYNMYDFHARGLDTWTGRFSGLDPVINYSLSGYASMMNNPISYIDPDGRNPLFIGAFVAIFANTAIKMAQGKPINSMWNFLKPGIAGVVGGGLGSLAPIGILPGMAYGAGSGALTGSINSALNGGNIGQGALYGAIGGGVFGGISGGIQANNLGADIWTGYRAPHSMFSSGNIIQGGTPVEYGAESVQNLYSDNFSDVNMNGSFFTNKGESVFPEENGSLISGGKKALAVTKSTIWKGGDYHKIYFGRNAFSSKEQLSFVLTHELGHVIHSRLNLSSLASESALSGLLDNEGHVAIQTMTFDFLKINKWNYLNFSSQARPINFIGASPYPQLLEPIKTLIRKIK
jgi:RHS repeat-associated protein